MVQTQILPTYHFLLIAPNLGSEWLFDAARLYWETFRPTVVTDFVLLQMIPPQYSIGVTLIARRDLIGFLGAQLGQTAPTARLDPIVYDYPEDAQLTLDGRARLNQPFGVPLPPPATLVPPPTLTPTPGEPPPPTRPPGGFITQTPTPDPQATPAPIQPTPGAITGDNG